jgi:hypothetical protein
MKRTTSLRWSFYIFLLFIYSIRDAESQEEFEVYPSSITECTPVVLKAADISGDGFIDQVEYLKLLRALAPSEDCDVREIGKSSTAFEETFESLACLCTEFGSVAGDFGNKCCLREAPFFMAFAAPNNLYNETYDQLVCEQIENTIRIECYVEELEEAVVAGATTGVDKEAISPATQELATSPPPANSSITGTTGDDSEAISTDITEEGADDQEDDEDDYYEEDDDDYVITAKDKASAILPKITSLLSILGSSCIIAEVVAEHKRGRGKATNRLLFSMSVSDIIFSTAWFFSTWAAPKDADYIWNPVGTTATCEAQGFMVQLGWTATPLFNICLSWYYLLMVRYNWHEVRLKRLDPWVHGSIWALSLTLAIFPIPMDLYNNTWEVW